MVIWIVVYVAVMIITAVLFYKIGVKTKFSSENMKKWDFFWLIVATVAAFGTEFLAMKYRIVSLSVLACYAVWLVVILIFWAFVINTFLKNYGGNGCSRELLKIRRKNEEQK